MPVFKASAAAVTFNVSGREYRLDQAPTPPPADPLLARHFEALYNRIDELSREVARLTEKIEKP